YFCLLDANGKLLPRFINAANHESKDPAQIVAGNEMVVSPRLTEAAFFFQQDEQPKRDRFSRRLAHEGLQTRRSTVLDKLERVSALAGFIAERIGGDPV